MYDLTVIAVTIAISLYGDPSYTIYEQVEHDDDHVVSTLMPEAAMELLNEHQAEDRSSYPEVAPLRALPCGQFGSHLCQLSCFWDNQLPLWQGLSRQI